MRLKELLKDIEILKTNVDLNSEIKDIKIDSKKVKEGDIFVALEGMVNDGHSFCIEAMKKGANALIVQKEIDKTQPFVQVADTRNALSIISGNFYGNRHRQLKLIYIVGTNGKTTTSYILNAILNRNGNKTAVIGTLGAIIDKRKINTDLTTPDPMTLHYLLNEAYKNDIEYVILEASAHAIFLRKLDGLKAEIAIFTNISQDHLDYFKCMDKYANVKLSIFDNNKVKLSIINSDDTYGRGIIKKKNCVSISYGINNPAEVFAVDIVAYNNKSRFIVNAFDDIAEITLPLVGQFNIYNALSAITAAKSLSVPMDIIRISISSLKEVSGRFNIIKTDITVIIDYAHTPDGLENLLKASKTVTGARTITVFGCGGDRDKTKRPLMGKIAGMYSDFCIITSDNPRFEDPMAIIKDIEGGVAEITQNYICIKDRANAIAYAVKFAEQGDKIIIAGKGSENYLDIMGVKLPYSDKKTVKQALRSYRN